MSTLGGTFVRHFSFPLAERLRGTRILAALRFLEQSQFWSRDQIVEWQWKRVTALLRHAYDNTAFYRERLDAMGTRPEDIKTPADFANIPALTKRDLKASLPALMAKNIAKEHLIETTTGGTTADYTTFYLDKKSLNFKLASTIRHDRWCGWEVGESEAIIWPASIDFKEPDSWKAQLRNLFLDRKLRLFAGVLNEEILDGMCRKLRAFGPALVRGFPNPMSILAEHALARGSPITGPTAVKSVGEPLSEGASALIGKAFNCPVYNCYLSRESGTIASQCERRDSMHINAENLYLEFETDDGPAKSGEPGALLVTDLNNYGMPFIRYRIGDVGVPLEGQCECGRGLPLMEMNAGRESDFLVSPVDGSYVMGLSLLVPLVENAKVGQIQIVQDKPDHLTVRIARNREFTKDDLKAFEATITSIFAGRMRHSYEFVDGIVAERSGKYRFAIRQITEAGN